MIDKEKPDKNNIGNAGEYYIASILSSKGYVTTITLGRAEAYDIIAIRPYGKVIDPRFLESFLKKLLK